MSDPTVGLVTCPVSDEEVMAIIDALDPGASLKFSKWTGKWYVAANLEIGDGTILRGITEHHDTPHDAIQAFFSVLTNLSLDEYVASTYCGQRREWRWNGAAFAEVTRHEALTNA